MAFGEEEDPAGCDEGPAMADGFGAGGAEPPYGPSGMMRLPVSDGMYFRRSLMIGMKISQLWQWVEDLHFVIPAILAATGPAARVGFWLVSCVGGV